MVAGRLVGGFVEPPNELLEDVPHLDVGNAIRVEVYRREPVNDHVEAIGLIELDDLSLEAEVVQNGPGPR